MDRLRSLFGFDGRFGRARFILATLANLAVCLLLGILMLAAVGGLHRGTIVSFNAGEIFSTPLSFGFGSSFCNAGPVASRVLYALGAIIFAGSLWFFSAAVVKRLHDRARSGAWIVPFVIAPPLLHRLWDWLDDPVGAFIVSSAASVLTLWGIVELVFLRGTAGPNRFGPDPLHLHNAPNEIAARR